MRRSTEKCKENSHHGRTLRSPAQDRPLCTFCIVVFCFFSAAHSSHFFTHSGTHAACTLKNHSFYCLMFHPKHVSALICFVTSSLTHAQNPLIRAHDKSLNCPTSKGHTFARISLAWAPLPAPDLGKAGTPTYCVSFLLLLWRTIQTVPSNNMRLFSYSSGCRKYGNGLPRPNPRRCRAPSGGSRGDPLPRPFQLPELRSMAHGSLRLYDQQHGIFASLSAFTAPSSSVVRSLSL